MCELLGVSASGYYAWCRRPDSPHAQRDRQLKVLVRASFTASKRRYGSPRIHRDLREDHDERVSRKRVIRLMQEEGLKARIPKRFVCTTDSDHELPVAANLLNRELTAGAANQRWVGDTPSSRSARAASCTWPPSSTSSRASSSGGRSGPSMTGTWPSPR